MRIRSHTDRSGRPENVSTGTARMAAPATTVQPATNWSSLDLTRRFQTACMTAASRARAKAKRLNLSGSPQRGRGLPTPRRFQHPSMRVSYIHRLVTRLPRDVQGALLGCWCPPKGALWKSGDVRNGSCSCCWPWCFWLPRSWDRPSRSDPPVPSLKIGLPLPMIDRDGFRDCHRVGYAGMVRG